MAGIILSLFTLKSLVHCEAVLGIKVEIERLVISILLHYIWVTYSGSLVSFYYITGQQDVPAEQWPLPAFEWQSLLPVSGLA